MYGIKSTVADFSTGGATDNTIPVAIPGLAMQFTVEEPEMWVKLSVKALGSAVGAGSRAELMLKVDTTAPAFVGACVSQVTLQPAWEEGSTLMRLTQGAHTVAAYLRSNADGTVATVHGTILPCVLEVLRLSNNTVLAHGVDAKFQVTE